MLFPVKMVQEQEEHSSNCLELKKKNRAMKKVDMTTEDASITNSTSVMMTTVAGDENAIGYISLGSLNDM